jgi:enamine deaminase RidA (YjgF/YER057c/UK114 family)
MKIIDKLKSRGLHLPQPIDPLGSYKTVCVADNQLYVSGLGPFENGKPLTGIVGQDITLERAQHASRLTMLMILASVEKAVGLDSIDYCSRLTIYIRAVQDFIEHPKVANGASDLLAGLFDNPTLPARSAIGVHTLPMGIPVEIDSIFQLKR